jgi:hypothetical protein
MCKKIAAVICGVVLAGLMGCKSGPPTITLPMTPDLISEVGPENMQRVSYYLSKEIRLVREDTGREAMLFQEGVAIRVDKHVKDVLVIGAKTPGFASANMFAQASYINYRVLGIEFEEATDNQIGFAVVLSDPEGRFDILFDDEEEGIIRYAGYRYRVTYAGQERPFLMVKVAKNLIKEEYHRKAEGRKISGAEARKKGSSV